MSLSNRDHPTPSNARKRPHLDPAEMALRGRIGAYSVHSRHDPRETTTPARAAFLATFEEMVDPDGVLTPAERQRRALAKRREHFARMALKSAAARRKRAGGAAKGGA